jgi:hypothetical protein
MDCAGALKVTLPPLVSSTLSVVSRNASTLHFCLPATAAREKEKHAGT